MYRTSASTATVSTSSAQHKAMTRIMTYFVVLYVQNECSGVAAINLDAHVQATAAACSEGRRDPPRFIEKTSPLESGDYGEPVFCERNASARLTTLLQAYLKFRGSPVYSVLES